MSSAPPFLGRGGGGVLSKYSPGKGGRSEDTCATGCGPGEVYVKEVASELE